MKSHPELPQNWAEHFGLALAPLLEKGETRIPGSHQVLLDGGYGSFALSVTDEPIWSDKIATNWSWSSNLPHHVTVTQDKVAIVRWDKPSVELLTRSSVESRLDDFYNYLVADRVRSNQRVVDRMLSLFRRVRSLVSEARLPDDNSVDAYLALLNEGIRRTTTPHHSSGKKFLENDQTEIVRKLSAPGVELLLNELFADDHQTGPFRLYPNLAIRHAGSEIFQEAHFELLRAPTLDMFSYIGPAESRQITRGGAHFTPPALGRTTQLPRTLTEVPG